MSDQNLNGDGCGDTSGLVYGFENGEIRKVIRSGYGHHGVSPGEVVPMSTTKSTLNDQLPALNIPGQGGLKYDDCGEQIPAFACEDCGDTTYVGRTCGNPTCERGWPSAVKSKAVRGAGKLEGMRRNLYVNEYNERADVDFNHVVASLPDLLVDSDQPIEHALKILKVLLEEQFGIKGFLAIYHPYRIKDEYRKEQYDHGGAEGQGDMTWKDVHNKANPYQYLKHEPHFHLFFAAKRYAFDYTVTEAIERKSGWVFNRIEKKDSSISVRDLEDLVHQLCYCFSHAGIQKTDVRDKLASRMKGDLHNIYVPDDAERQATAVFCEAAPKLLGVRFKNTNNNSCDADIQDNDGEYHDGEDNPIHELYSEWDDGTNRLNRSGSSDPAAPSFDDRSLSAESPDEDSSIVSTSNCQSQSVSSSVVTDSGETCGGDIIPIREAASLLDDDEWCEQARYSEVLKLAFTEWQNQVDDDGKDKLNWLEDSSQRC